MEELILTLFNQTAQTEEQLPAPAAMPKAEPCTFVIFGASGDLARRKLIPALYNLACEDCIGGQFRVLGVGRTPLADEDFRSEMHDAVRESKETADFNEASWRDFESRLSYVVGDPNNDEMLDELRDHLDKMHNEGASRNHIYYLSIPPSVAPNVIAGIGSAGLADESEGYRRIVIEKPFGRDLKSAHELNEIVAQTFREEQVFRIDHYLGKETVQNIMVFRFGNTLFEPIWNRNYVSYVEITAAEPMGIGDRAGYYEEAGALRDMVTNHLLQLLMLVAMEPPVAFEADSVREEKVKVLRSIRPMTRAEIDEQTIRGQYITGKIGDEVAAAYRDEKGVQPDSQTETYAAIRFGIENWRWAGVPFYVRAGKRMSRHLTEVAVHFRRPPQMLFGNNSNNRIQPNAIILQIQPDEGISLSLGAKIPGTEMKTGSVKMNFDYEKGFGIRPPAAYETLLLDVMQGEATLFTRRDEVEGEWRLITPIEEAWAAGASPLQFYAAGTDSFFAADELLRQNNHKWRKLDE